MRRSPVIKATVFLGLAALLVAGCASKKSSSGTPTAASTTAAAAAGGSGAAAAARGSGAAAAATGAATISVQKGSLGDYLIDGSGKTVYLYTPDTSSTPTCYGECAAFWPAVLTKGAPQAGTGATANKLGTSPRTDGTTQVTYNGHPLYEFMGDQSAGDINGQGKDGIWYVLTPAGTQVGGSAASPAAAPKSGKY